MPGKQYPVLSYFRLRDLAKGGSTEYHAGDTFTCEPGPMVEKLQKKRLIGDAAPDKKPSSSSKES